MNSIARKCLEIIGVVGKPKILPAEYERFFDSPCWLAFRQAVAEQLDLCYKQCVSPMSTDRVIHETRGAIRALSWMLEARDELKNRIEANIDMVNENRQKEEVLNEVLKALEREHNNGRRTRNKRGDQ